MLGVSGREVINPLTLYSSRILCIIPVGLLEAFTASVIAGHGGQTFAFGTILQIIFLTS
jgi:hypothetical protein